MSTPFGSEKIIKEQIFETTINGYWVGYDISDTGEYEYRWDPFIRLLLNVIHEFAFGFHEGPYTDNKQTLSKVVEAARAIYKITEFQKVRYIYINDNSIQDDTEDKYLRRGEFGELILHLLLRDFHNTIPLLSKIYFKDSFGQAVHGFDAVHIEPVKKTLWLGEAKIYFDPKRGISSLIEDIKTHIKSDYLNDEFSIISKKIRLLEEVKERDYWLNLLHNSTKLSDQLLSITIPLLCVYSSDLFNKYNDEDLDNFKKEFQRNIYDIKKYFDDKNDHPLKTKLNIILLLFPIKCKKELIKRLHYKLSLIQSI